MRMYLIPIAVLATALFVFVGLVQPPLAIKQASDTVEPAASSLQR
jgi:hypothetical protein